LSCCASPGCGPFARPTGLPKTVRSYDQALRLYTDWLAARGHSLFAADIRW